MDRTRETTHASFDDIVRRGGDAGMRQLSRFFAMNDEVYESLRRITKKLQDLNIPYAVAGGMALNAHGYRRGTTDVDILISQSDLATVHQELEGLGYVRPFANSKNLKDTQTSVRIEFLVAGQFPGDGKPKPVAFPIPQAVGVDIDGIRYIGLPTLVELKLASGMTNAGRLKDLGDVQELIRVLALPQNFGEQLNPYVRGKFIELWSAVHADPTAEEQ
jgi:hypothetical protein